MNNKKKIFSLLSNKNLGIYFLLIVFSLVTCYFNEIAGTVEICAVGVAFLIQLILNTGRKKKLNQYIEELFMSSGSITKDFVINSVLPLAILKDDLNIIWYNNEFSNIFFDEEIDENNIKEIIKDFPQLKNTNEDIDFVVSYKDEKYHIIGNRGKASDSDNKFYYMLHFINVTNEYNYKNELETKELLYGKIVVDNYEESINGLTEAQRAVLIADMDKHIFSWAQESKAVIKKQGTGKYYIFFEKMHLDEYIKKGFERLREITLTDKESNVHLTLSIGIGMGGDSPQENEEFSAAGIDMALGRGGDQVVIKDKSGFSFYGGASKEIEKRSKVRSRFIAQALEELIESKENIVIMGHSDPDMDAIGSALGIYRAAISLNKKCYIVMEENTPSIETIVKKMKESSEYKDIFINKYQAENYLYDSGILVIVDTHRKVLLPYPELLNSAETTVLIDHHRKSADFMEDITLIYHEAYASSTSELVVEIIEYMNTKIKLNPVECQALYAGILIDTKNFTFKTGVRTFEAASFLRRSGLDTAAAKELIKSDINDYRVCNEIISKADIYKEKIAICVYEGEVKHTSVIARAADELINIKGIDTTFVIYKDDDVIKISARSIGTVNVQVIMEKMGGGGHQLSAGTKITDGNIENIKDTLKTYIDESIQ